MPWIPVIAGFSWRDGCRTAEAWAQSWSQMAWEAMPPLVAVEDAAWRRYWTTIPNQSQWWFLENACQMKTQIIDTLKFAILIMDVILYEKVSQFKPITWSILDHHVVLFYCSACSASMALKTWAFSGSWHCTVDRWELGVWTAPAVSEGVQDIRSIPKAPGELHFASVPFWIIEMFCSFGVLRFSVDSVCSIVSQAHTKMHSAIVCFLLLGP